MKRQLFIVSIVMFTLVGFLAQAQQENDKQSKKQERLDHKNEKALAFQAQKERLGELAMQKNLVLEANALYGRHGFDASNIGPNNFILVDSNNFVLQTSSYQRIGQNGMGGITVRGTINSYKVTLGEGKSPTIVIAQISTFGLGPATLTMRLNDPQNSQATFSTASGETITFSGPVTSMEEAKVFQGMRLY